jgi:hypothetical protein
MIRRLSKFIATFAIVLILLPIAAGTALTYSKGWPTSWRSADWSSSGLLPAPATATDEAVVYVMAARSGRWKGIFAVHHWLVLKPQGRHPVRALRCGRLGQSGAQGQLPGGWALVLFGTADRSRGARRRGSSTDTQTQSRGGRVIPGATMAITSSGPAPTPTASWRTLPAPCRNWAQSLTRQASARTGSAPACRRAACRPAPGGRCRGTG